MIALTIGDYTVGVVFGAGYVAGVVSLTLLLLLFAACAKGVRG